MQRQADVLGVAVACDAGTEATARGAAALAAIAAGLLDEAEVGSLVGTSARYEPAGSADARDAEYAAWTAWVRRAADLSAGDRLGSG